MNTLIKKITMRVAISILGLWISPLNASAGLPEHLTSVESDADRTARIATYWTPQRVASAQPRAFAYDQKTGQIEAQEMHESQLDHYQSSPAPQGLQTTSIAGTESESAQIAPSVSIVSPHDGADVTPSTSFQIRLADQHTPVSWVFFYFAFPDHQIGVYGRYIGHKTWEVKLPSSLTGQGVWMAAVVDTNLEWTTSPIQTAIAVAPLAPEPPLPVERALWQGNGLARTTVGRLVYELPTNAEKTEWRAYQCSGSVVTEAISGRSIILTAAHCVYDRRTDGFARNVMFIPSLDTASDSIKQFGCADSPFGCWVPRVAIAPEPFATSGLIFDHSNDFAFYVVSDEGAFSGPGVLATEALDEQVGSLPIRFDPPTFGRTNPDSFTYGVGYPNNADPDLMYCAQNLRGFSSRTGGVFLENCRLTPGVSGGPFLQNYDAVAQSGEIVSVHSVIEEFYGVGMVGPDLDTGLAECLFEHAKTIALESISTVDGEAGVIFPGCP